MSDFFEAWKKMRREWPFNDSRCPECGCRENHSVSCKHCPDYYRLVLSASLEKRLTKCQSFLRHAKEQAVFWQGKYSIVKTENNALRKMVRKSL